METKQVEIKIVENGPALVNGEVKIIKSNGEEEVKQKCALCRCGKSKNQPYCDGSHASKTE